MLNLKHKLKLTQALAASPNLAGQFSEEDRDAIAACVWDGYVADQQSRAPWLRRTQAAMDLAMQVVKEKSFPWPNCANVAFPLVTIAALQFHSRAYPTLVSGNEIVKCRVIGEDPDGSQRARADRISCHMSYQVMEEDQAWEEQHDRALISLPILGSIFKKTFHDASAGHNTSQLVLPQNLVMDYHAKSVEKCARKTHIIPKHRNELWEEMVSGTFLDYTSEPWFQEPAQPLAVEHADQTNLRLGLETPTPDHDTPFTTLEQHCLLDLDGDGYAEPYIVTIEASERKLLRLVARWSQDEEVQRTSKGKVIRIRSEEYFTKYELIPSPDDGVYGLGFGIFLGPLNESVNSLVNQLLDAGTWATTAGGFLGRGAKIRGGRLAFAPNEWKNVDSTGDDLRKSIVPHDVREPSAVLFNLLSLLINYTERISGSTDMMVGENPGQNTPAETSRAMVEQGMKVYNSCFKRVWRSMKQEFKKLFLLNAAYMPMQASYGSAGYKAFREDYLGDPERIAPAADPNATSETARVQLATTVKQAAMVTPGYDKDATERYFLKALKVDGADVLFPGTEKMPPGKSEKLAIEEMKIQAKQLELQQQNLQFVAELMEEQRLNSAQISKMEAEIQKLLAEASDVGATTQVTAMQTMVGAMKDRNDAAAKRIEVMLKPVEFAQKWKELAQGDRELDLKDKEIEVAKIEARKPTPAGK